MENKPKPQKDRGKPLPSDYDPADFCDVKEAVRLTGLARGTLYRMAAERRGPTTYLFGKRRLRYRRHELLAWFHNEYVTVREPKEVAS